MAGYLEDIATYLNRALGFVEQPVCVTGGIGGCVGIDHNDLNLFGNEFYYSKRGKNGKQKGKRKKKRKRREQISSQNS